jgi:hypothetical protein
VRGSCYGRTVGMFGEAAMAEPWDVWVQLRWLEPIRQKRGLLGGCDAHIGGEALVGMLHAR